MTARNRHLGSGDSETPVTQVVTGLDQSLAVGAVDRAAAEGACTQTLGVTPEGVVDAGALDEATDADPALRDLARMTGGEYFRAGDRDGLVAEVYLGVLDELLSVGVPIGNLEPLGERLRRRRNGIDEAEGPTEPVSAQGDLLPVTRVHGRVRHTAELPQLGRAENERADDAPPSPVDEVVGSQARELQQVAVRGTVAPERAAGATMGVSVYDYLSGGAWCFNGDRWFHAASTIKVAVLLALFGAIDAGRFTLDSRLHVRNRFLSLVDRTPFRVAAGRDARHALVDDRRGVRHRAP